MSSTGLHQSVKMNGASRISKDTIAPSRIPTQTSSVKTSDVSEGVWDEENRSDSTPSKQADTSNGFGSSNPSVDSPRPSSGTWLSTFKPTSENVIQTADSLRIQLQEGDVCVNGFWGLL